MSTWQAAINALEQRLRTAIGQAVANVLEWAPVSLASSDGKGDAAEGLPSSEPYQWDLRRVQHAGFRSRFSKGNRLILKRGTRAWSVAEDDGAAVALDDGAAKLYSPAEPTCCVHLDNQGILHIDSKALKDIIVNGGSLKAAADTDPVNCGTLTVVITPATPPAVPPFTVVVTYTPPGAGATPAAVMTFQTLVATPGTTVVSLSGLINVTAARRLKV